MDAQGVPHDIALEPKGEMKKVTNHNFNQYLESFATVKYHHEIRSQFNPTFGARICGDFASGDVHCLQVCNGDGLMREMR